jgi:TonB family protein
MLRMQEMMWVVLCSLSATMAYAESAKDAVNTFQDSIGKNQLVLRNFSGEDKVHASWTGTTLGLDPPRWRTMGILVVDSVKLKGHTLVMRCVRHIAVRDKSDKVVLYYQLSEIEIEVDLGGADPAAALPQLKEALFYPSIDDALAAIPKGLQDAIPARIDKSFAESSKSNKTQGPPCDCADKDQAECTIEHLPTAGVVPPKYLRGQDPEFSEQARSAKLNGSVDVRLRVDKNGQPTEVWVTRPLGLGLDEAAAKSVLTYKFRPAMCHDTPVSVYLGVEVKFEIH